MAESMSDTQIARRKVLKLLVGGTAGVVVTESAKALAAPAKRLQKVATLLTPEQVAPPRIDIPWLLPDVQRWANKFIAESKKYDMDPAFAAVISQIESKGDENARNKLSGAVGVMQVVPHTAGLDVARWRGMSGAAEAKSDKNDPYVRSLGFLLQDPVVNISFGIEYLARQLKDFGSFEGAAVAYNGGPNGAGGHWRRTGRGIDTENERYRLAVIGMMHERNQPTSPTYDRYTSGQLWQDAKVNLANTGGK